MRQEQRVILKRGKDKPIHSRHHWIFSGAIASSPEFENGDILPVFSFDEQFLGYAYFHHKTSIAGRMVSFDRTSPEESIRQRIDRAIAMRKVLFDKKNTTSYRLIHSESDGIPGLIVDRYGDILVFQATTLGIERLKSMIAAHLVVILQPRSIYEKSTSPSRREEGLHDESGLLVGDIGQEIEIRENDLRFIVDIVHGQKTGFFLDQREMRRYVEEMSHGRRVLNCFGYTGGYSVYALRGGATSVNTVDISDDAIQLASRNVTLNNFSDTKHREIVADAFDFLRNDPLQYELVILDPPAFAKKKSDVVSACRGYKEINRLAMQKMPAASILVTSSCSYHIDEKLFQTVLFQAARDAGRVVRIIGRHRQASDHPVNIYHPEGEYLKSLVLFVE